MKLFHNPRSRATITHWMLEECGAEYELVHIDFDKKENKGEAFREINPAGKLPALTDGAVRMYENSAICLYLADRYAEAGLAPAPDAPERGRYLTLCVYATSQLEPAIGDALLKVETSSSRGWTDVATALEVVERELGDGPYLLGERFSAADVLIGSTLWWYKQFGGTRLSPTLTAYVERVTARPAAAVAFKPAG